MKYFWAYLLCVVSFFGCVVPQTHACIGFSASPQSFIPNLHVDNGYHDDDGQEHKPIHTRREQRGELLFRDNRLDDKDELNESL